MGLAWILVELVVTSFNSACLAYHTLNLCPSVSILTFSLASLVSSCMTLPLLIRMLTLSVLPSFYR